MGVPLSMASRSSANFYAEEFEIGTAANSRSGIIVARQSRASEKARGAVIEGEVRYKFEHFIVGKGIFAIQKDLQWRTGAYRRKKDLSIAAEDRKNDEIQDRVRRGRTAIGPTRRWKI